jgi:hypothetical protein
VTVPDVTVSGQITFDRVPHKPGNTPGLDYPNTFQSPARGVVVRAVQEFGPVLATGRTDDQGRYSFDLPGKTRVNIQARAQIERGGSPSWNFKVVDNTSNDALYALTGAVFDTGLSNVTADLNAGSGWDEVLLTYGDVRAAAPFAIIDTVYEAVQLIVGADPEVALPSMNLNWSPFNRSSDVFDPDNGSIVTTAYFFSEGQIYVLGDQDVDTDEYDPHVIAHEFAHYVESMLGRTDSTGGPHTFIDELDPRLAFSEGWANAFSAMVLDDPIYKDSLLSGQASGFAVDIESNTVTNEGWFNESSVHSVLYDVFDNQADGVDATALGFGPIFEGMVGWHANSNALTSIYSLLTELKSGRPADEPNIDALLEGQDIVGAGMNIWGSAETNNAGNNQDVLPIYGILSVDGPAVEVCSINSFGQFNRLSNRRFVRLFVATAGTHSIEVTGPNNSDPDLVLFRKGFLNLSEGITEAEETLTLPLAVGTYVLEVYEAANVYGGNDFGRPPGKTCLDVTVTRQ